MTSNRAAPGMAAPSSLSSKGKGIPSSDTFLVQVLEEKAGQGDTEALDDFLTKFASKEASSDSIPADYGHPNLYNGALAPREKSMAGNTKWMDAY